MLNDLLVLTNLLLQTLHKTWVNLGLANLALQQSSESLRFLNVEGQFGFVLLDFGKLQSLFQILKFFIFGEKLLIQLFHFKFNCCYLTFLVNHYILRLNSLLVAFTFQNCHLLRARMLVVEDLPFLKFLEEVVHVLPGVFSGMKHLFHHLFNHIVFLSDKTHMILKLGFKLLIVF